MSSPGVETKLASKVIYARTYNIPRRDGHNITVRISCSKDHTLKASSPESGMVWTGQPTLQYSREKSLDEIMYRAVVEYIGLLDDLRERMP